MSLIGIEEHWTLDSVDHALRTASGPVDDSLVLNEYGDTAGRLADLGTGRIAAMDEQGLDMQVLALAPPGAQGVTASEAIALRRDANDAAAVAVRHRPDRFRAMTTLPLAAAAACSAVSPARRSSTPARTR